MYEQAAVGAQSVQSRGISTGSPPILDMFDSAIAQMTEKISRLRTELATHNEKLLGGKPTDPRTPPPPPSVPVPYGGVIGSIGGGLNSLYQEISALEGQIRQAISI